MIPIRFQGCTSGIFGLKSWEPGRPLHSTTLLPRSSSRDKSSSQSCGWNKTPGHPEHVPSNPTGQWPNPVSSVFIPRADVTMDEGREAGQWAANGVGQSARPNDQWPGNDGRQWAASGNVQQPTGMKREWSPGVEGLPGGQQWSAGQTAQPSSGDGQWASHRNAQPAIADMQWPSNRNAQPAIADGQWPSSRNAQPTIADGQWPSNRNAQPAIADGQWSSSRNAQPAIADGQWPSNRNAQPAIADGQWSSSRNTQPSGSDGQWSSNRIAQPAIADGQWSSGRNAQTGNAGGQWSSSGGNAQPVGTNQQWPSPGNAQPSGESRQWSSASGGGGGGQSTQTSDQRPVRDSRPSTAGAGQWSSSHERGCPSTFGQGQREDRETGRQPNPVFTAKENPPRPEPSNSYQNPGRSDAQRSSRGSTEDRPKVEPAAASRGGYRLIAKHNFSGNPNSPLGAGAELSFKQAEQLTKIGVHPEQELWWLAKNENGQQGYVPSTYMMVIEDNGTLPWLQNRVVEEPDEPVPSKPLEPYRSAYNKSGSGTTAAAKYYCEVCERSFNGPQPYAAHMVSKVHRETVEARQEECR